MSSACPLASRPPFVLTAYLAVSAALALLLAGCGDTPAARTVTPPATQAATATPTIIASPTVSILSQTDFTCPASVQGDLKIFTDTATLLNIAYPAAWSETHCQRTTLSDGSQSLVIGNLLRLKVAPRRGLTVRQWADAQKAPYESITLTPITVRKAIEAYKVEVDEGSGGQAPGPLQLTDGLLAGSQYIYQSFGMIELNNQQDTPTGEAYWQTLARIAVS